MTFANSPRFKVGDKVRLVTVEEIQAALATHAELELYVSIEGDDYFDNVYDIRTDLYNDLVEMTHKSGAKIISVSAEPHTWNKDYCLRFPNGETRYMIDCLIEPLSPGGMEDIEILF